MIKATNLTTTNNTPVFSETGEYGITTLIACNHSSTDAIVNAYVIPADQASASPANQILKNLVIVGEDTFVMDMEKLVLANGDRIVFQSNIADTINVVVSAMPVN